MGLWETITGRSRPKTADLDALFLVPSAAVTLQTALGLRPTGAGAVCFRAASGPAFGRVQDDVVALLDEDPAAPDVETTRDSFGFTWLLARRDPSDPDAVSALCTDLHAVNTALEDQGFGPSLLCSLVPFTDGAGRTVGLVYLYKQGTFYPFAPSGEQTRDNLLEVQVRDQLRGELPVEQDLGRWMALWGAPGL
ncbi:MAG: PspA-associated protein PspAB [Nocardioides sp.]